MTYYGHGMLGLQQTYDDSEPTLKQSAADGAKIWRTTADMRSGDVAASTVDAVKRARAHGMDVLICATYSGVGVYHKVPTHDADRQAWANKVGEIIAGCAPTDGHVHVEVWNEANHNEMNEGADPVAYFDLLRRTYKAVKAADKKALVVTSGTSPDSTIPGERWSPYDWTVALYQQGHPACDAFAHHPYSYPYAATTDAAWNAARQTFAIQQVIAWCEAAAGKPTKPIWGTEVCFPTAAVTGGAFVSEHDQVVRLADLVSLWRAWSWSGPLIWFGDHDSVGADPAFAGALRHGDGSPKLVVPWFTALAKAG